jgi:pimeloyl-ACP methyl ester carboxylesterase
MRSEGCVNTAARRSVRMRMLTRVYLLAGAIGVALGALFARALVRLPGNVAQQGELRRRQGADSVAVRSTVHPSSGRSPSPGVVGTTTIQGRQSRMHIATAKRPLTPASPQGLPLTPATQAPKPVVGAPEAPLPVAKNEIAARAVVAPKVNAGSVRPLGSPVLETSALIPLALTGLKPSASYEVTLARPDAWDDTVALVRSVKLCADGRGEIHLGEADVRALPGVGKRKLTSDERAAAGTVFAKLTTHQPRTALKLAHPELAQRLDAAGAAQRLHIDAVAVDGSHRASFEQSLLSEVPGVTVKPSDFTVDGYVGESYLPGADKSKWKTPCLVIGGSGGGMQRSRARELAALGHPTLVVEYFSYDPDAPAVKAGLIPSPLAQVQMGYFKNAIERFRAVEGIDKKAGFTVIGESRGAEAAYLLKSFPDLGITNTVLMRPFTHLVGSKCNGPSEPARKELASWMLGNEPAPFAAMPQEKTQFRWAKELSPPASDTMPDGSNLPIVELVHGFRELAKSAPAESRLDLSNFDHPVHMIGGGDDKMWPSGEAVRALSEDARGLHVVVSAAGHYNDPSRRSTAVRDELYFPQPEVPGNPDIGGFMKDGGTPLINAVSDVAYSFFVRRAVHGENVRLPFPEVVQEVGGTRRN